MSESKVTYETLRNFYCDKAWMQNRIDQLEWDMKMICNKTPYAAIQYIRKSMGYDEYLREYAVYRQMQPEELMAVLEEIQQNSKEYQSIDEWFEHVERYKEMLTEQARKSRSQGGEGVALMTMHGVKGLEYDTVFIIPVSYTHLAVYHVCEPEIKEEFDEAVYDEQISMMEMVLDVDDIVSEMTAIRDQVEQA